MKNILFVAGLLLISFSVNAQEEGIKFFHGPIAEAMAKAKATGKLIFVDGYTSWCGPCKRMSSETFTKPDVGNFYNANFINMKIDMEKEEGPEVARKYNVSAYPTLLFIDGDGKLVLKDMGFKGTEALITVGRTALKQNDKSPEFKEKYDAGDHSPELLYNYAYALLQSGQDNLKIANEYLKSQKDLKTENNLKFIFDFTGEADSRIFGLLLENKDLIIKERGAEAFTQKVKQACQKTVQKAIDFKNEDLLEEAKSQYGKYDKAGSAKFSLEADMDYYLETGQKDKYMDACGSFAKKFGKTDPDRLHRLARQISYTSSAKDDQQKAVKWCQQAAEYGKKSEYYQTLSNLLMKTGDKVGAVKAAEKALELAKAEKIPTDQAERLLQQVRGNTAAPALTPGPASGGGGDGGVKITPPNKE